MQTVPFRLMFSERRATQGMLRAGPFETAAMAKREELQRTFNYSIGEDERGGGCFKGFLYLFKAFFSGIKAFARGFLSF